MCTTKRRCESTSCRAASRSPSGPETRGERHLVFLGQDGNLRYAVDVRVEAPDGACEYQSGLLSD